MKYSVILIHGGDFSNISAPLLVDATNFQGLNDEIRSSFDLGPGQLQIAYCGEILSGSSRLPRDGALLHVSVKMDSVQDAFSYDDPQEPPFRTEINEAFQFVNKHQRTPMKDNLRLIIEDLLLKRYELFPNLCRTDLNGSRLCSNYDLFMASLNVKVMRHHEIVQCMLLEVHKVGKDALQSLKDQSEQRANLTSQIQNEQSQSHSQSGAPPSVVPLVQSISQTRPSSEGSNSSTITAAMLQQALNAAQQHMVQTGQNVQSQLPENRNIQEAANQVLSEVAALAGLVERGVEQLREMGILNVANPEQSLTTEAHARRLLQDNGGNVDAVANAIFEQRFQ